MEQEGGIIEEKGTSGKADVERRMMISRDAVKTMRYKRDEYSIDEIGDGTCGCLDKNIIRTKGLRRLETTGCEMRNIERRGKRNFECKK